MILVIIKDIISIFIVDLYILKFIIDILTYILFQPDVLLFDLIIFVCNSLILFILKLIKTLLKLTLILKFTFNQFSIGTYYFLYLMF